MTDIVERLREAGRLGESYGWGRDTLWFHAANEIEKLREERRVMEGALRAIKAHTKDAHPMTYMDQLCRIACAALGEKE